MLTKGYSFAGSTKKKTIKLFIHIKKKNKQISILIIFIKC